MIRSSETRTILAIAAIGLFVVAGAGSAAATSSQVGVVHESVTESNHEVIDGDVAVAPSVHEVISAGGDIVAATDSGDELVTPLAVAAGIHRPEDSDDDLLAHETRRGIVDAAAEIPGRSLAAIADVVGVSSSTTRYHVAVLDAADLVETTKIRGRERVFTARFDGDQRLYAALADESTERVLTAISEMEPVGVTELADAVDRAPSTTSRHVSRLEADGLVVCEREHRTVEVSVADDVRPQFATDDGGR